MTKHSARHSVSDSEMGSEASERVSRISAVLCPAVCALLVVCVLAVSFLGSKLAYERYDAFCASRRFDVTKLYIFPNHTIITNDLLVNATSATCATQATSLLVPNITLLMYLFHLFICSAYS